MHIDTRLAAERAQVIFEREEWGYAGGSRVATVDEIENTIKYLLSHEDEESIETGRILVYKMADDEPPEVYLNLDALKFE